MSKMGVVIKRVKTNREGGRNVRATLLYIDDASGHGDKLHTAAGQSVMGSINILADDDDRDMQRGEIAKNHIRYKGKGRKLDHYILSYDAGLAHDFTAQDFRDDVKTLLKHLGLEEHACMYAVHANTKNLHIHVAVDRVSLEWNARGEHYIPLNTGTVLMKNKQGDVCRHDIYCQHAAMHEICVKRGYSIAGILTDMHGKPLQSSKKLAVSNSSTQVELRTGQKSPERLLKELADNLLSKSTSWPDALDALNSVGIIYKVEHNKKGQAKGAVLISAENSKVQLLSSRLAHKNSFKGLSKRLGSFPKDYQQTADSPAAIQVNSEITPHAAKKNLHALISDAVKERSGWDALEQSLMAQGYVLTPSGGSFVITFNSGKDKLKLSEIDRAFSKKKLDTIFVVDVSEPTPPHAIEQPIKPVSHKRDIKVKTFDRSSYYDRMLNMSKTTRNKRLSIAKKSMAYAAVDSQKNTTVKSKFNQQFNHEELTYEPN